MLDEPSPDFDSHGQVCVCRLSTSVFAREISRRRVRTSSTAAAVTITATHTGPSAPGITRSAAAARTGPAAAPTLSAAVAYDPAIIGAPVAMTALGRASESRPAIVTTSKEPTPKSTSAADTHHWLEAAVSVTIGAMKVRIANVPAFTSAGSSIVTTRRMEASWASSIRNEVEGGSSLDDSTV